jgi:inositol polyphosphate-4-phosphatase
MRFNTKELAYYASTRFGKADKEGALWMKEYEGLIKKKETYTQRWFLLTGNLLFYCKDEHPDSMVVGLIIVEKCRVEVESTEGNRNGFRLMFDEDGVGYSFVANSAREQDEWRTAVATTSYEYLRMAFSELRGQLMHLTGKDPLVEDHPLGALPITTVPALPTTAPAFEGKAVFELSLACSSLVGSLHGSVPNSLIVTSCMSPPQAYWIRYAQTEVVEHNCDPQFYTTVVFYAGSVSLHTRIKFEVFDKHESKMCPIGQATCTVMDIIKAPDTCCRLEVKFDDGTCGYLHIRAWKSEVNGGESGLELSAGSQVTKSPTPDLLSEEDATDGGGGASEPGSEVMSPAKFSFSAPMDNIVVRSYLFPVINSSDEKLKVTEVMGEGRYSFSIPMQLLELFIEEETRALQQYASLEGLRQGWEIARQEVALVHSEMISQYKENCSGLQAQLEAGVTFKKSTAKGMPELDFVPVNLHIQQMKVGRGEEEKERVVYMCVTAGCPTAYSHKFKQGGLAKLRSTTPLANVGSTNLSTATKTQRGQTLFGQIEVVLGDLQKEVDSIRSAARGRVLTSVHTSTRVLAENVHKLKSLCNVNLIHDSLRDLAGAVEPEFKLSETNVVALCRRVEEHVVSVEAVVSSLTPSNIGESGEGVRGVRVHWRGCDVLCVPAERWCELLEKPLMDFLSALTSTTTIFRKAVIFLFLRESYSLLQERVPLGLKSYLHRHDIVYSQAVTVTITSFVFKLLQSFAIPSFLTQLHKVGFLLHWESLLSTHGDEQGMLEDFIVAIADINQLTFKLCLAETLQDFPQVSGSRYKMCVEVPVQKTMFRLLPAPLQAGAEISVSAILFTQGINEQQTIADRFGDSTLQDQINIRSLTELTSYCSRYRECLGNSSEGHCSRPGALGLAVIYHISLTSSK